MTNNILGVDIKPYYLTILDANYSDSLEYSAYGALVGNTISTVVATGTIANTSYIGYTVEVEGNGYAVITGVTVTTEMSTDIPPTVITRMVFATDTTFTASPNVRYYISKWSTVNKAAYNKMRNDTLYGVSDIESKIVVKGIQQLTGDVTTDWLALIPGDTRFDESFKHCVLYMILLQCSSLTANEQLTNLSRHHYRLYLDSINNAIYSLGGYLASLGYVINYPNVVNTIELVRI
jgi:hypothetical protein